MSGRGVCGAERGLLRGMGEEILILVSQASPAPQTLSDWLTVPLDLSQGDERVLSLLSKRNECCPLRRQGEELLSVVMERATREQWVKWLRIPLEQARLAGKAGLADRLVAAGAAGGGAKGAGSTLPRGSPACGTTDRGAFTTIAVSSCCMPIEQSETTDNSIVEARSGGGCSRRSPQPSSCAPSLCCKSPEEVSDIVARAASSSVCCRGIGENGGFSPTNAVAAAPSESCCASSTPFCAGKAALVSSRCCREDTGSAGVAFVSVNVQNLEVGARSDTSGDNAAFGNEDVDLPIRADEATVAARVDEQLCLHRAAIAGDVRCMRELLAHGDGDENTTDLWSCTALHRAAEQDGAEAVRLLLAAGLDVGARDMEGYSPLHFAAARGASTCIVDLLQAGAQVADRGVNGDTPLHSAVRFLSLSTVQLLLDWDADELAQNGEGHTPMDVTGVLPDGRDIEDTPDPLAATDIIAALEAAPARRRFRIWKRRAWIVMLRARTQSNLAQLQEAAAPRVDGAYAIVGTCVGSNVGTSSTARGGDTVGLKKLEKTLRCGPGTGGCCGRGTVTMAVDNEYANVVKRTTWLAEGGVFQKIVQYL